VIVGPDSLYGTKGMFYNHLPFAVQLAMGTACWRPEWSQGINQWLAIK